MTRTLISLVVFLAGLAVVGWIGVGYLGTNPLALAIIALIGIFYLIGAVELQRYQRGTDTLARAVDGLTVMPTSLDSWLTQLQPGLRGATRLRIEGQRVALPGPSLTPYLVGLLVLLGMLGTFLGMVETLRGTGIALESAADLQAIRASLAAPVKGLGFAFGTSVAGVATSAALGLLATIARRSRIQAAQRLDVMIATTLRPYSQNHQGEQTYKLMQQQAETMPVLVDRLEAMVSAMEKQTQAVHDQLAASQDAFYSRTEKTYSALATSIEQSLKQSVADSAQVAGEAIQPAVQATLAGLARETSAWQDTLAIAIRHQLETLSGRFENTTASVADIWNQSLAQQQQTNSKLADDNQQALIAATDRLAQHSAALLQSVDQSHIELQDKLAAQDQRRLDTWIASLDQVILRDQQRQNDWKSSLDDIASSLNASLSSTATSLHTSVEGITSSLDASLKDTTEQAARQQQAICDTLAKTAHELTEQTQAHARDTITEVSQLLHTVSEAPKAAAEVIIELRQSHADLQAQLIAQDQERLNDWKASLDHIASNWGNSLQTTSGALHAAMEHTASTLGASLSSTATSLHASVEGIASSLDTSLKDTTSTLRQEWAQTTEQAAKQQQKICDTLAKTAHELTEQTQAHARDTITEVSQLLHTVSEAPKAAAEVITELRQSHADLQEKLIAQDQERLNDWKASLDHIASNWGNSLQTTSGALHAAMEHTASTLSASLNSTATSLHTSVEGIASSLDTSLKDTTSALRQEWAQTTEQVTERQQIICETLAKTAYELTEQTQAHARDTITEVSQLLHTVSEAPKAAAEVITELRQSHVDLQAQLIAQDQERLNDWKASLDHIASNWGNSIQTTSGALHAAMENTASTLSASLNSTATSLHTSVEGIAASLDTSLKDTTSALRQEWAQTTEQATKQQQVICETLAKTAHELTEQTQAHARDTITEVSQLLHTVSEAPKAAAAVITELRQSHVDLQEKLIAQDQQRLDNWKSSLDGIASTWNTSLETAASTLNTSLETTAQALNTSLEKTTTTLHSSMEDTAASLSASLTGTTSTLTVTLENTASTLHNSFEDIASSMNVSLENTAYTLRQEWEQVSAQTTARQQEICDTLVRTAQALTDHTQTQARETIAEVAQLVQTAAEAPRAAASVISELRQKLTDGMARDNELLEERGRLMETLSTLLDAVNHASTQQREAVDGLIAHSSDLLERVGSQFTQNVQSETDKLAGAAAHITGSAVEVASLGEAFGTSVQLFNQSNDKLVEHLQRIEVALDKSMSRSDEQLAYYVAQAREVVDLSIMSQKQIIEDLQQLSSQHIPANSESTA